MPTRRPKAVAQPMGKTAPARPWAAQRSTILDAERYTRFVTIMKRALLIAAAAVILAVLFYSLQPRDTRHMAMTFQNVGTVGNDLAMIKPRLTGTDSQGNPFVITADNAVQLSHVTRKAKLNNVEADMTLKDGGWITITATSGLLDATPSMPGREGPKKKKGETTQKGTLALMGNVALYSDTGYELHTDRANIDLTSGLVVGPHPVRGQGPLGTVRADRFEMIRKIVKVPPGGKAPPVQGHVALHGHVQMVFNVAEHAKKPKPADAKSKEAKKK